MPACGGVGGGHSREGTVGPGETPTSKYLRIQKSSAGFKMDVVRKPPCFGSERPRASCSLGKVGQFGRFLRPLQRAAAEAGRSHLRQTPNPLIYGRRMDRFCSLDKCIQKRGDPRAGAAAHGRRSLRHRAGTRRGSPCSPARCPRPRAGTLPPSGNCVLV